ncbi:Cytochrome P450 71A1 [Cinnamomum micranthum f. kanehirae]|uniref:Cytochrome P450 71A1 n=1 Tax=Cinnamomum micranthum f. kanehirae TaxID=337451 RepID=A0A443Q1Y3_9MAGN|nr:Cytochrome P450 71A1 [Cinnamomum micranthum f. kanehirae]
MATALVLSLLFLASAALLFITVTRSKKPNQPPSPPKFPIIGNLLQLGSLPHRSLRHLSDKYGPLMLLHLFRIPTLIISSPEMAQQILKTHDLSFAGRPQLYSAKQLFYGCKDILFSPYGEYWRQVRKICVLELLSNKQVKSFRRIREEEVVSMIDQLSQSCITSSAVDLRHVLTKLSNSIVSRVALGRKYGGEDGNERFFDMIREYGVLLAAFCIGDYFPSLAWVDVVTGLNGRLNKASRTMDAFLDRVIKEHQERKEIGGQDGDDQRDFVDVLLHLQECSEIGVEMDRDSIKALILDMFSAATETTAITMEWVMAELTKNSEVMKKAQDELRRVMAGKQKVEEDDLHQMHYLKCVIKETLRLHPVAPLLAPKESNTEVMLQGYSIPSKTRVIVNAWAIARDPKSWERPDEFLPERFANNPIDFKGQNFQYIPFGAGRRACPGISFAIPTMELSLANLLYFFDWKMPDGLRGEDLDMSEAGGVTVGLRFPLRLVAMRHIS